MTMLHSVKNFFGLDQNHADPNAIPDAYEEDLAHDYHTPVRSYSHEAQATDYSRSRATAIVTETVTRFEDAPNVGTPFLNGDTVIFDMSSMAPSERNRIFDFATGLAFAMSGTLRRVDDGVWALTDKSRPFSDEELRSAYFNN